MKIRKRLAAMNEGAVPGSRRKAYNTYVNAKVRERYSAAEETALVRKKLAGISGADEEFAEYSDYVEQCKATARTELGMEVGE